jgi:Carboxypeptidase regulatory-like domain/TonB dependent receptor/TonB-dependent Receptor Plug Domain
MCSRKHAQEVVVCFAGLLVLFFSCFIPAQGWAQVAGATISGTVTDASNAVVPGTQIVIRDTATGISRTVTADASGFYTVPNLQPGNYELSASASGFSTLVQSGITLTVGAQQVLNIKMKVGQVTETVEVTGEAPVVQLESSSINSTIASTTVRELPLNGRDWTQLAALQPGVTSMGSLQISSDNFQRGNRGFGTQLAISGGRPQQNNFRIDGINVNDYVNSGPASVLGAALGVDAISEFSVLTSNYSAEYGRTSGGVVNAITRAGTNQFHGTAYWFLRDEDFDARSFFDHTSVTNPGRLPPFHRNQYGVSGGAPILKNRMFVFFDFEGVHQAKGFANADTTPSAAARNGIINFLPPPPGTPPPFPKGCVATGVPNQCAVTVDPLVKPYLALWGLPSTLIPPGNVGTYVVTTSRYLTEKFFSNRVDYKISDKDSIFGSWQYDHAPVTQPDNLGNVLQGSITHRVFVAMEESHTFSPQLVNNFRIGYNRSGTKNTFGVSAINPAAGDTSLGIVPGNAAPSIVVGGAGITSIAGGLNPNPSSQYAFNSFQGFDDAFLTKGIHSLKLGFAVERIEENFGTPTNGQVGGQYRFGSLINFLTNQPTSLRAGFLNIPTLPTGLRQSIFAGYVQDDVRLRPNLTVNVGLRYEMATVPTGSGGTPLSTLRNPFTDAAPHLGSPYFNNPTFRNFEPRVGFAWDPFGNGKTSVRAGFGVFDVLPLTYEFAIPVLRSNGATGNASPLGVGSFPTLAYNSLLAAPAGSTTASWVDNNPKRNYVMQWNLSVQRELLPNLTAMVAYVGNRGAHQPFRSDDMDVVLPTLTSAGYLWPVAIGKGTRLNPNFGRIETLTWASNSFFDALELQIVKRLSHGFQIQGSYTWGKAIDESSGSTHGDPFGNSISADWLFDRTLRRGPSDFNIGQNLVINYIWNLPSPKSGYAAWVFGGWQLGGIFQTYSGLPFTPQISPDPLGTRSTLSYAFPNVVPGCNPINPNPKANTGPLPSYLNASCFTLPTAPASMAAQCAPFKGAPALPPGGPVYCANLLGNIGRNSVNGPGLINFDSSLFKNIPIKRISETFNAQFRVEAFNVLNRANFVAPLNNEFIFDTTGARIPTAGLMDTINGTAREIQFALKVLW